MSIAKNELASMGGKARSAKMTDAEKSESARHASEARWNQDVPKATHTGEIHIGELVIPCAVLEDKTRVLTQRGFVVAMGRNKNPTGSSIAGLPVFLSAANLKQYIDKDLERSSKQIKFRLPEGSGGLGGNIALGYRAELLPQVCNVYLRAKFDGTLKKPQMHIAERCMIMLSGFASVGIIALVDEATGFQYDRPRRDLEEQLKRFLSEELIRYVKGFPVEYFKHLCRLKGVEVRPDMRLPQYFGHLTNDLIYRRIAPGLVKALKERRAERGKTSNKMYWWTSEDIGYPALQRHLGAVVALMKINTDYDAFYKQLNEVASIYSDSPGLFDNPEEWKKPETTTKK